MQLFTQRTENVFAAVPLKHREDNSSVYPFIYMYKYIHILQQPNKCFREKNDQRGTYVFALDVRKKAFG